MKKEARARIKINRLLSRAGWRFFDDEKGPANIALEVNVKIKKNEIDQWGDDFEKTADGFNVCTLEYDASLPKKKRKPGPFPVVGSNGITGWHDAYLIEGPAIIVGRKGSAGEVGWIAENCFPIDTTYYVRLKNDSKTNLRFLFPYVEACELNRFKKRWSRPRIE